MNGANTQPIPSQLREQPDFAVPPDLESEIDLLIAHYPKKRSAALMLLHAVQERYGYISRQALEWIAARLELAPINIWELVTFYPMFQHAPLGKFHFRICRTLSCALAGAYQLHEQFCRKFSLDPHRHGPQVTSDGRFSIEFVECLASCGTAPVILCNEQLHEQVTAQKANEILGECR
jgi:NADH-quinone oxidoreductase subunit E